MSNFIIVNLNFVHIGGVPLYLGKAQYEYWKHTQLIIDVTEDTAVRARWKRPEGNAFHTRSRLFTDAERLELQDELRL